MGKADAVLDVLPSVYGAGQPGKLLVESIRSLAHPLEAADGELFMIQRAHRLPVAPHARDIVNLAAALDLDAFHFEDLLAADVDYPVRLEMMRERVRRVAALHLDGLGTPWAVVEAAAIFLAARVVPDANGDPLVRRLDGDGFSHRATIEFPWAEGAPRETIVLHENPFRRLKVEPAPRWPGDGWTAENNNVDAGPVRVAVEGVGDRTVFPTVFCADIPGGIVFNGIVPDGETLLIDQHDGATLGERDVTRWLTVYSGGMYDYVNADAVGFAVDQGDEVEPFTGSAEADPDDDEPWRRPARDLPRPPIGRTTWNFGVAAGIYDGDDFDVAVFDPPEAPVGSYDNDPGADASVYDIEPSGIVGMAWDERIACSFKLMLPERVPEPSTQEQVARVAAVLPRFRPAGVTAFVDTALDGWVLGRSVLRDPAAADGEGVDFGAVRLVDRDTENLVPFDPVTS